MYIHGRNAVSHVTKTLISDAGNGVETNIPLTAHKLGQLSVIKHL